MRILVKTANHRHNVRRFHMYDFFKEFSRQSGADLSYKRQRGKYDVVIGGINKNGLSVKIITDLHEGIGVDSPHHRLEIINSRPWDIVLMRYMYINYEGIPKTFFQEGIKAKKVLFPWSLCEERWKYSEAKDNDVTTLGTSVESMYPLRADIRKSLPLPYKTISGNIPVHIKRDNNALKKKHKGIYVGESYINALQRSKVMLTDASRYGCPVKKYFEAIATGCLLMADRPNHADEIGLVAGENYVEISKDNWREKLDYYLANETERLKITRNARELFERKHTNKVRAKELIWNLNKVMHQG